MNTLSFAMVHFFHKIDRNKTSSGDCFFMKTSSLDNLFFETPLLSISLPMEKASVGLFLIHICPYLLSAFEDINEERVFLLVLSLTSPVVR